MIDKPLIIMIFTARKDWPHIAALYSIITIVFHKTISFVHVTFIIACRAGSFVMHDYFNPFRFGILLNSFYIKIRIRGYKIKNIIFRLAKPIFPAFVPPLHQYRTKPICSCEINVFFYISRIGAMFSVGFSFCIIGKP
ncbi:hypothetical protein D3C87_1717910 [compost metagenome]